MNSTALQSKVKLWLQSVLQEQDLKNLTVNILENSEKTCSGDILFLRAFISKNQSTQEYKLALKCSKRTSRNWEFIQDIYINEIYFYDQILSALSDFQKEKGVENILDSVSKFYGHFLEESVEVIVLENLKEFGYELWDKSKPVTIEHIEIVLNKYAEFHAISIAMQDQEPEKFEILAKSVDMPARKYHKKNLTVADMKSFIEEVYNLLRNDVQESVLLKWRNLKQQVNEIMNYYENECKIKVILHGDCCNNNFMYLYEDDEKILPKRVAILDWQLTKVLDLSYFLFTCISEIDLMDLDDILGYYYSCLRKHVEELGSCLSEIYIFEDFMNDWKKHCKYGILVSSLELKICSTDKDEVIDMAQSTQKEKNEIKNKDNFKNRIRRLVENAIHTDLI